jgi:uncharacterized protein (DUF1800 family)
MLPQAADPWTIFEAAHLLNRAGFGGNPADIKALHALGRLKAVESLLQPPVGLDEFPQLPWAGRENDAEDTRRQAEKRRRIQEAVRTLSPREADQLRRQLNGADQRRERERQLEAQGWWWQKILNSKAPLREKMTLFWHDHFSTSVQKVKVVKLMVRQNDLFRSHALGNFRRLTQEVVKDPAMMMYLDTQKSGKDKPNENFAREVMELFTLGEGHYTEADIREAARAFTGYRIDRKNGVGVQNPRQWDGREKTILGKTGNFNGPDVINLLFEQPAAAELLAKKLWEYFAAEDPPTAVVKSLAAALRSANYDVVPVLREIFLSKQFYSTGLMRDQIKCPVHYLAQLLKQLEIHELRPAYMALAQQQLGQSLFSPPNVAGWDWGKAWINTNTLLTRYNIAGAITNGSKPAPVESMTPLAMTENGEGDEGMESMQENPRPRPAARAARKREMAGRKRAGAKDVTPGPDWKGPDYEKIVPRELRKQHADLVDTLIMRFFQAPVSEINRKRFIAFAEEQEGVVFTNHEVAELVHLMLSTPEYQLT